jgi:glycosyltransferase involved in cell wall biosynthesis
LDGAQSLRARHGIEAYAPLFVNIGRFAPAKNQLRLIRVFKEIHDLVPRSVLLVVGRPDTDLYPRFERLVGELGLKDGVIVSGEVTAVQPFLLAADVMLFPSAWEGLPGAVVEAAACGTPVLASRIPPHEELASWLPLVRCLELSAANSRWAETAVEMSRRTKEKSRVEARDLFRSTPLALENAAERYLALWRIQKPKVLRET